jgi:uncharacterized membrane protein (Fun14 family)
VTGHNSDVVERSKIGMVLEALDYGGLGLGFAAKRTATTLALVLLVQLAGFRLLQSNEVVDVDREALAAGLAGLATAAGPPSTWFAAVSAFVVGSGVVAGFLLGYARGG